MIRAVPEAAEKLKKGSVNLTSLAKTRQAIRNQEKVTGKVSQEQMAQAVNKIENQSSLEVEATLFEIFPEAQSAAQQERQVLINQEETRLTFNLDKDAMADLAWVKAYLSHSIPGGEVGLVVTRLLKEFRQRHDHSSGVKSNNGNANKVRSNKVKSQNKESEAQGKSSFKVDNESPDIDLRSSVASESTAAVERGRRLIAKAD